MTKAELINGIHQKLDGTSKAIIKDTLTAFAEVVAESLADGEDIRLHKFGTIKSERRSARQGRNPSTGKPITIPEKMVVKFKPATALVESAQSGL